MNKSALVCMFATALVVVSCNEKISEEQKPQMKQYKPVSQELYDEIAKQDSLMFSAFNEHDSVKLRSFFSPDLEFYHDKGGKQDFEKTMQGFGGLFARNKTSGLRRDLVPGSFEVYPINNYGAIETCMHKFCHKENGRDDCGVFKNVMIWQNNNGQWKVTRVISYDH